MSEASHGEIPREILYENVLGRLKKLEQDFKSVPGSAGGYNFGKNFGYIADSYGDLNQFRSNNAVLTNETEAIITDLENAKTIASVTPEHPRPDSNSSDSGELKYWELKQKEGQILRRIFLGVIEEYNSFAKRSEKKEFFLNTDDERSTTRVNPNPGKYSEMVSEMATQDSLLLDSEIKRFVDDPDVHEWFTKKLDADSAGLEMISRLANGSNTTTKIGYLPSMLGSWKDWDEAKRSLPLDFDSAEQSSAQTFSGPIETGTIKNDKNAAIGFHDWAVVWMRKQSLEQ